MSTNELNQMARNYFEIQQQIAELSAEADAIKSRMQAVMVEHETEELSGPGWRATWHNSSSTRFDTTAFKKARPELYAEYSKTTTGTRFTLNTIKAA